MPVDSQNRQFLIKAVYYTLQTFLITTLRLRVSA